MQKKLHALKNILPHATKYFDKNEQLLGNKRHLKVYCFQKFVIIVHISDFKIS